ncbi:GNAT family N-acetyltransferase [Sphingobacteriales bacterium UPWRP_1]|nr:GNAT family N-acetyltransferase [Sphingobacteriales bacterium TSM_CSM]PSJ76265.1 GNAT family N-acetyltransferase [Sphingobacteriales bacterium UPWRP_1]
MNKSAFPVPITYRTNVPLQAAQVAALYNDAGLLRPTNDLERMEKMVQNANLVISAWHNEELVGLARAIADFSFCCYLSDLAVKKSYQHLGIGKELVRLTKEQAGEESMLLLLSVPTAMEYYPKIGMEKAENAFIIKRQR